ncbi:response regulator, partial [Albidovulum sp.]|uniref:response regulator n=1 Tax=Albidovulum sp. TaxID=1872424 RepID=UPI0035297AD5
KLAGGTVKLANRAEGGALVSIRLPLRRAPDVAREPGLVLLVEDSAEIREEVREMLRALGHKVIEAASADEALGLVDLPGIEIVLSDVSLPGTITGVDLARLLDARNHPAICRLMTSLPRGDRLRDSAGVIPVLTKPFTMTELSAFLALKDPS